MSDTRVIVGAIAGAFGVKGEVRLKSFCADPAAIADYTPLYSKDGRRFATVVLTGAAANALTARIDGVATKEEADALKGTELYAERDQLPSLPDDEFYHADLIGLPVYDAGGQLLGKVKAVLNHGASDLLEIHQGRCSDGRPCCWPDRCRSARGHFRKLRAR
jgi:16S rRNA processing protein RimM